MTFVLGVPAREAFPTHFDSQQFLSSGDSLLRIPTGAARIKVAFTNGSQTVDVNFYPNNDGNLSHGTIQMSAPNFQEVERFAYDIVLPLISQWSYEYDVAIDIKGYEILEEASGTRKWVFGVIGKLKTLEINAQYVQRPELRPMLAAYREAISSLNPFYQFLSFYKVVEGIRRLRALRRKKMPRATNFEYRSAEKIPSELAAIPLLSAWGLDFFQPFLGKKFGAVLDDFRSVLRNAIAHLDPEQSAVLDRYQDVQSCERAIPVIKFIARTMLSNECAHGNG